MCRYVDDKHKSNHRDQFHKFLHFDKDLVHTDLLRMISADLVQKVLLEKPRLIDMVLFEIRFHIDK